MASLIKYNFQVGFPQSIFQYLLTNKIGQAKQKLFTQSPGSGVLRSPMSNLEIFT